MFDFTWYHRLCCIDHMRMQMIIGGFYEIQ